MKLIHFFGIFILVFITHYGYSQVNGCTDPKALNFNAEARVNDGSCVYHNTSVRPKTIVKTLPDAIIETSGLVYWNGGLWTHNDSYNEAKLYKIDTLSGEILQTITLTEAENIDWEDISQDEAHIFIGDFGNNMGNRTDLKIYIVDKSDIPQSGDGNVRSVIISFSFGDQQSFEIQNRNNDYDCESLISFGDSLFVFTKNWVNAQTRLYGMPKIPGNYQLLPLGVMEADGLITGADVSIDGSEIVLCGYKNYSPFIWLLFDFSGSDFFSGNKRRIEFPALLGTQTEGIAFTFGNNVYISSEKNYLLPPKLFKINTSQWIYSAARDKGIDSDFDKE